MMGHREPMKGGDEYDALSKRAKRFHKWRAGVRAWIKRKFNKRVRQDSKPWLVDRDGRVTPDKGRRIELRARQSDK